MTTRPTTSRAFTLIELLVVVAIIALLVAIGVIGLSRTLRTAAAASDGQALRSIRLALETFEQDHGFYVPLAYDADPLPVVGPSVVNSTNIAPSSEGEPVFENRNITPPIPFVGVYSTGRDLDFLRGGEDAAGNGVRTFANNAGLSDTRYSKYSLAIYLAGVLPAAIDGREGPLLSKPARDGSFLGISRRGTSETYESYLPVGENDAFATRVLYGTGALAQSELVEAAEHGGSAPTGADNAYSVSIVDRYGTPYRYYRWESGRNSVDANNADDLGKVNRPTDLNIPTVLQDTQAFYEQTQGDPDADGAQGNARLRSARWAVVSAGPDRLFGTESPVDLGLPGGATDAEILAAREQAKRDNIVEVGS